MQINKCSLSLKLCQLVKYSDSGAVNHTTLKEDKFIYPQIVQEKKGVIPP